MSKRVVSLIILSSVLFASICGMVVPVMVAASNAKQSNTFTVIKPPPLPSVPSPLVEPEQEPEPEPEQKMPDDTAPEPKKQAVLTFKYTDACWKLFDETGYCENVIYSREPFVFTYGIVVADFLLSEFGIDAAPVDYNLYDYFDLRNFSIPKNPLISKDGLCILYFEP